MKRIGAIAIVTLSISSVHADTYNYICKSQGKPYPLKVDDKQNTLEWKGNTYKIRTQEDCAKFGWHAERAGASFDFCTATKGYADFEENGVRIQCDLRR